jgi:hypothetical protein
MALEDFASPEVGIAIAATALIASPAVRGTVRRGLVYGLAGVLRAGDAATGAARGVTAETRPGTSTVMGGLQTLVSEARAVSKGGEAR